jgi:hypothetical protein
MELPWMSDPFKGFSSRGRGKPRLAYADGMRIARILSDPSKEEDDVKDGELPSLRAADTERRVLSQMRDLALLRTMFERAFGFSSDKLGAGSRRVSACA